jgi:hypothetical protein
VDSSADTPAALDDLIAAGLVSHEVIGDPARLGAEAATLRTLCGLVTGPVWRVGPFHYAFRAQPDDLGGRLADAPPEGWSAALETALQAALGPDAIWVSTADILAGDPAADLEAPLLLFRAQAAAVEGALASGEGPEAPPAPLQAVINARYAAEVARLTAGAAPGSALDARLAALETGIAALGPRLAALAEAIPDRTAGAAAPDAVIKAVVEAAAGRVTEEISRRLDAQAAAIEALGERVAALAASPDGTAALDDFRESVGLTLAEFLARIETGIKTGIETGTSLQ